jgi:hypothetical protein
MQNNLCHPRDFQEENLITVHASLEHCPYIYYRFCFHQSLFIFYDVQINAIIYVTY